MELFSEVQEITPVPSGNAELYRKASEAFVPDDFSHEQNLVIWQNEKAVLIAGCAHRGILNIVRQFASDYGRFPDVVIGGFHLHSRGTGKSEAPEAVDALARELLQTGARNIPFIARGRKRPEVKGCDGKSDRLSVGRKPIGNQFVRGGKHE